MPHFSVGAADGEVAQPAAHEGDDFVAARLGPDELRLLLVEFEQPVLERRQPEEVVLLGDLLGGPAALGAGLARLPLADIQLVKDAIGARVAAFVNVTGILRRLKKPCHSPCVARLGGADEEVASEPQILPQRAEGFRNAVGELLRAHSGCLGGALHLLAVLVGARQQESFLTLHAPEAANHVGHHRGIGVAQMRPGIHIVDGSGQVILAHAAQSVFFPNFSR